MSGRMEAIYERPRDYDLEHEGDEEDVAFYLQLLARWQPGRVMELAAGSGRVTIPLACAAAARGIQIVKPPADWRRGEASAVVSPRRDDQRAARFGSGLGIRVRHRRIEVDRIASLEHMLLVADVDVQGA